MTPDEFKEIRIRLNLTQLELGKKIHKGRAIISYYENGHIKIPFLVSEKMDTLYGDKV